MVSILYKWCSLILIAFTFPLVAGNHPIYVSVTEIEHNRTDKTLEVSCKIFTDDFEKTLRNAYKTRVDLIKPTNRKEMEKLVNDYVQKHLKISLDGKAVTLRFLGFEHIDEGIYSYYQADNVESPKQIAVSNSLLYEYKSEQMGIIHTTINGNRKSTKLNNPDTNAVLSF